MIARGRDSSNPESVLRRLCRQGGPSPLAKSKIRRGELGNPAFMDAAVELSVSKSHDGLGGPFGAVIVRRGKVIAKGYNQVTSRMDPTSHAEIVAIRAACRKLKNFHLTGCELYTSC